MSVIIMSRDGWAVCDSRCTAGHSGIFPGAIKKVIRAQDALIGVAGRLVDLQKIDKISRTCTVTELPDAIAEYFAEETDCPSAALIVTASRQLLLCECDGSVTEITEMDFWANGGCEDMCIGYLMHAHDAGAAVTADLAEATIKRVARFNSGIDDRVQRYAL